LALAAWNRQGAAAVNSISNGFAQQANISGSGGTQTTMTTASRDAASTSPVESTAVFAAASTNPSGLVCTYKATSALIAPTLVSTTVSTNFATTNPTKDTPVVSWLAGDLITVWGFTGDNATTLGAPTVTGLTFANVLTTAVASRVKIYLWTATAGSSGSGVIAATEGSNLEGGIVVKVWRRSGGFGAVSSVGSGTTGAPTVSYTVTGLNSVVDGGFGNWNRNVNARTYLTTNLGAATEDQEYDSATYATTGTWHNAASAATGALTIGLSAPTMDAWLVAGIEIKGAPTPGVVPFTPHRMPLGA
jgi:hypothetical protein